MAFLLGGDSLKSSYEVIDDEEKLVMFLSIDMDDIPKDELAAEIEADAMFGGFVKALEGKKVSLALGIKDDIVFIGMAKDRETLLGFGTGKKLIDLPAVAKLKSAIDDNTAITSVSFVSKEYAQSAFQMNTFIKALIPPFVEGLMSEFKNDESSGEIPFTQEEMIVSANELFAEFEAMFPEPSQQYSFSYLSDKGIQGYARVDATHPLMDGSKPLSLIETASENTIAFSIYHLEDIGRIFEFASNCGELFKSVMTGVDWEEIKETIARAELEDQGVDPLWIEEGELSEQEKTVLEEAKKKAEERHQYSMQLAEEVFVEIDTGMRKKFLPAIKGGESGLLIELVSGPNPWHESGKKTEAPLPLPSITLIQQHNNKNAIEETYDSLISKIESWTEEYISKFESEIDLETRKEVLEKWARKETKSGSLIVGEVFPPELETGIDPSVVAAWLISEDKLIFQFPGLSIDSLTKQHSNRIFGPAADAATKPSTSANFYDNRLLLKTFDQWLQASKILDGTTDTAADNAPDKERKLLDFTSEEIDEHFNRIWNFTECWKGYSSRSYIESGGTVTESLYKFEGIDVN